MSDTPTKPDDPLKVRKKQLWIECVPYLNAMIANPPDTCFDWPSTWSQSRGYGYFYYQGKHWGAHRYTLTQYVGPAPSKDRNLAAHRCNRPICVNPKHLYWATPLENSRDALEAGTTVRGEAHYKAKLTADQVREIRRLDATTGNKRLGKMFGVNPKTINRIQRRIIWSKLDD